LFMPKISGSIISNQDLTMTRSPSGSSIGGGGITVNVNAGMGSDGAEIGRQVVDAIKKYERRSGKVFAAA
jgi:hypothetical protein